ncbi:MAG: hypothetical protein ACI837_001372 [Crocinitomicaceae bacterium]|jgi:hypothetical protein
MNKKSFLIASTACISMLFASCSTTCESEEFIELSNGYGLAKSGDDYFIINPDSMKDFKPTEIEAGIKDGTALKIDADDLKRINDITSTIHLLV